MERCSGELCCSQTLTRGSQLTHRREINEDIPVREMPCGFYTQVAFFLTLHEVGKNLSGLCIWDWHVWSPQEKKGWQCWGSGEGTCAWGASLTSCNSESRVTQLPPLLAVPFLPLELGYNPIFRNGKLTPAAKPRQTYTDLQCWWLVDCKCRQLVGAGGVTPGMGCQALCAYSNCGGKMRPSGHSEALIFHFQTSF